jgi:hypothetical protein
MMLNGNSSKLTANIGQKLRGQFLIWPMTHAPAVVKKLKGRAA